VLINPNRIRILAIGKLRRGWLQEGVAMYLKRLPGLEILELKDSSPGKEAEAVLAALKPDEALLLLSEEGEQLSSRALAQALGQRGSQRLALAIGGADGHAPALKARAQGLLSLSALTFPHELARLLLLEQLYRASTILQGGPYHRD